MSKPVKKTLGLALSGSGNRTTFYIGFLEVLEEEGIKVDYLSACSGGAIVAAAYAAGTLAEFRDYILQLNRKDVFDVLTRQRGEGGLYKLDYVEEILSRFTKGLTFEQVETKMAFTAVDINNGELVDLCIGDIAHAARISCTTPALFEPVTWGNRVLVDGGVLSVVPISSLKKFSPDFSISINLALTRNVFTGAQMNAKKMINFFSKFLLLDQIHDIFEKNVNDNPVQDFEKSQKIFSVWGRSLDLAIYANKKYMDDIGCDLKIEPNFKNQNRASISSGTMKKNYEIGRQTARDYLPKIKEMLLH